MLPRSIDIFCEIIDNYGDIGVVYRLARELRSIYKGTKIRVILNRVDEFLEINKRAKKLDHQEIDGVIYLTENYIEKLSELDVADIIIEAFGCSIDEKYMEKAKSESTLMLNLEYLSGEKWIEDVHLMESPLGAEKLRKYFFMPGFSKKSGGIIVNKREKKDRDEILKKIGIELEKGEKLGSIFTYEKNFTPLLETLKKMDNKFYLLIFGEKSKKSIEDLKLPENVRIEKMNFLNQEEYEDILNISDFNFVRGEDSVVRAMIAGRPFVWHIYLQENLAHMDKIDGFLNCMKESLGERRELQIYSKLLREYNVRYENSLERGIENFDQFFLEFSQLEGMFEEYSRYLIENCNLIEKLKNFIDNYKI